MSKKIQDEMVHGKFCFWNEASRSYVPYDLEGLTALHLSVLEEIDVLRKLAKGKMATIDGLHRDIRRLKNG